MFRAPGWFAPGLLALAAAAALHVWAARRRRGVAALLGREATLARAAEDAAARRSWAARLRLTALALVFVALAGPQWGIELTQTRGAARQVVVAVDVSLSMQTPDVKPSRLERAKASLSLLLDQLRGDRVGVVAFAGDAQIVCPLTSDVEAAKQLLGGLEVGAIATPGTAIGSALRAATAMIGRYPGSKSIVLLTDGEDHRSDPLGAAREAAASGVRVFAVGIGSPEGEPIPLEGGGYKKDAHGATVVSRLGEETLSGLATQTGGAYYRSSPGGDEITDIAAKIKAGQAASGLIGSSARWRDRYAWPLSLAFLLLLAELCLPLLAPRAAAALALLLVAAPARAAFFEGTLREGNKQYEEGRYEDALDLYGQASGRKPSDPRPAFNAGDALYRLERPADAAQAFGSVSARRDAPRSLRAAALYNLGNARYRAGDYAAAAEAFRRALALAPEDQDARRNLILSLRSQKQPPPKNQDKKNGPGQPPPPQNKDDQNQSSQGGNPNPPRPRPQDSMSREEAERVMQAVGDREKEAQKKVPASGMSQAPPRRPPSGEDW